MGAGELVGRGPAGCRLFYDFLLVSISAVYVVMAYIVMACLVMARVAMAGCRYRACVRGQ